MQLNRDLIANHREYLVPVSTEKGDDFELKNITI